MYVLAAFVICVGALTINPVDEPLSPAIFDGTVASDEIRSLFYFDAPDLLKTQEAREQERAKVPDHYRTNTEIVKQQLQLLRERIETLRNEQPNVSRAIIQALKDSTRQQEPGSVVSKAVSIHAAALKELPEWEAYPEPDLLALWLTPDTASIPTRVFMDKEEDQPAPDADNVVWFTSEPTLTFTQSETMGTLAEEALEHVLTSGVRADTVTPAETEKTVVLVRSQSSGTLPAASEMAFSDIPDTEKARKLLSEWLTREAQQPVRGAEASERWARIHDGALAMAAPLVISTIQMDTDYTEDMRLRAAESVEPVLKQVEAGEIIQDRGKRWTKQSRSDVETYIRILTNEEHPLKKFLNSLFAHTILVLLVFLGLYKRVHLQHREETVAPQTAFHLALLLLCATLVIGRIISPFEPTGYVLPVAAGGILYAILVGPQRAALFGALAAALISAQYQYSWRLLLVSGAMTIAGAFSTFNVRRRSDMTAASLVATLVGVFALGAAILATDTLFNEISGLRNFSVHQHDIVLPANAITGPYHFHLSVVDQAGNVAEVERELYASDEEGHHDDHNH